MKKLLLFLWPVPIGKEVHNHNYKCSPDLYLKDHGIAPRTIRVRGKKRIMNCPEL